MDVFLGRIKSVMNYKNIKTLWQYIWCDKRCEIYMVTVKKTTSISLCGIKTVLCDTLQAGTAPQ